MKELIFGDHHLRNIVQSRLEAEFRQYKYKSSGEYILVEKPKGGKVAVQVTKEGFKIIPVAKKTSFWIMALIMALGIQLLASGLTAIPSYFTIVVAFISILFTISIVSKTTAKQSQNNNLAERIEEYLEKEMLLM